MSSLPAPVFVRALLALLCALGLAGGAGAAAFRPTSDAQVLASVPSRKLDPQARALQALRADWRAAPQDLQRAVRLAQAYFDAVGAEGDPRYVGYAQAVLAPWFAQPDPPAPVRVLRAMLLQFDHRFDDALRDLQAVTEAEPDNAAAWSWRTAILLVQARYAEARASCTQLAALAPPLVGAGCAAQIDALTGRAAAAADRLRRSLQAAGDAEPALRLWALTRLAETEERRGAFAAAEAAFRQALASGVDDVYLQAAYADFLLDRGRPAEVLALLQDKGRADVLLLRLAQAARATGAANAAALADELAARFEAAARRGDTTHRKEAARFELLLRGRTALALQLAQANFAAQQEAIDARILMEAALAARQPLAAEPALRWIAASGVQSVALQPLAAALQALPR